VSGLQANCACKLPEDPCMRYMRLGASLYMPATRGDLRDLLAGHKLPSLRSLVVCTEDAVRAADLRRALANLSRALQGLPEGGALRFVRPRNPEVLATILAMPGAHNLHGVSLPKFDLSNAEDYFSVLSAAPWLWIMPIIETDVAFSLHELVRLRERLAALGERVVALRIGGNDLLQRLGMKRPADVTAYETPLRMVIDNMIVAFRPHGFELSAPVFEHLERHDVLAREVALDVAHGLFAKTAIHPAQIRAIETAYAVDYNDAAWAEAVLDPGAAAVFRFGGQMVEPATHHRWASTTLRRREVYGLSPGVACQDDTAYA
jgi:citrate lyase beta subunit